MSNRSQHLAVAVGAAVLWSIFACNGPAQDTRPDIGDDLAALATKHHLVLDLIDNRLDVGRIATVPLGLLDRAALRRSSYWAIRPVNQGDDGTGKSPLIEKFDDESLVALCQDTAHKRVAGISLIGCRTVSDVGLQALSRIEGLRYLNIGGRPRAPGPRVSDKWIQTELPKLRKLEALVAWGAAHNWDAFLASFGSAGTGGITGASRAGFARLPALRFLDLTACRGIWSDGDAGALGGGKLERLHLSDTGFDDQHVDLIGPCKGLRVLDLSFNPITDAGLARLSVISELIELNLEGCRGITDSGLQALAQLPRLQILGLGRRSGVGWALQVTEVGIQRLLRNKPSLEIRWEGRTVAAMKPESR